MAENDNEAAKPAAPANQQQRQNVVLRYVDRPDCGETFADAIHNVAFDGHSLRIEFAVTRMDDVKPNTQLSGRRYPVCRLVLAPVAAVDLINRMQQIGQALSQAGVLRQNPAAPAKEPDQTRQ